MHVITYLPNQNEAVEQGMKKKGEKKGRKRWVPGKKRAGRGRGKQKWWGIIQFGLIKRLAYKLFQPSFVSKTLPNQAEQ